MTINKEDIFLLSISHFHKFGPKKLKLLKNRLLSWSNIWSASLSDITSIGITNDLAQEFIIFRNKFDQESLLKTLEKNNIKFAILGENNYPKLLSNIEDAPYIIYYKGDINLENQYPLAIVGARKYTEYGKKIIETLVADLAYNGLTIISGLAIGIDSLAHNQALNKGAKTIAVLGSGINKIYPSSNERLAEKIINSNGGIISEFPIEYEAFKQNFPQRNRIVSGLSLGVLVIEAQEKSGSLITAYFGLEQNREVFAVPGDIDRLSSGGTNKLIKKGAIPVTKADDILEVLKINKKEEEKEAFNANFNDNEKTILKLLSKTPINKEELIISSKLDTKHINSTLSILEIKNVVKNIGNNNYIRLI